LREGDAQLHQDNEQLRHRLDQALRLHFGQRSEQSRPRRAWWGRASTWASTHSPTSGKRCRGCLRWGKSRQWSGCWSGSRTAGYCVVLVNRFRRLPGRGKRPPNNGRRSWPGVDVRRDEPSRDEQAAVRS
jgi:hypothetical protein